MADGRDPTSVHRSIQRWLSTVLQAPWDVQPVRKEPQQRPLAVIRPVGPAPSTGTAYVREYDQPYEAFLYPPGVENDPLGSEREAREAMRLVLRAIDSGNGASGRDRSYSLRIPLFDYADVGVDAALPADREPVDYLVIRAPTGVARPDPDADDLFTVVIDFRANWRDDGDTYRWSGQKLQDVSVAYALTRPVGISRRIAYGIG
jgi:hypothetical protein